MKNNNLGPISCLEGDWVGDNGSCTYYSDDKSITISFSEEVKYRKMVKVVNCNQKLSGFSYIREIKYKDDDVILVDGYPSIEKDNLPKTEGGSIIHQESGFIIYDEINNQLFKTFSVSRGISIIAGCTVAEDTNAFCLRAELGSNTYGILTNIYLSNFRTPIVYESMMNLEKGNHKFEYFESMSMWIPEINETFDHINSNTLYKVDKHNGEKSCEH